jgi:hypothetical protein
MIATLDPSPTPFYFLTNPPFFVETADQWCARPNAAAGGALWLISAHGQRAAIRISED